MMLFQYLFLQGKRQRIELARAYPPVGGPIKHGPRKHMIAPAQYGMLARQADNAAFAVKTGNFAGYSEKKLNQWLIIDLFEAVDKLISRDVYIQGMCPHEFNQETT